MSEFPKPQSERFSRSFRIRNHESNRVPPRHIEVHASPSQVEHLEREGYLVRERLLPPQVLEDLRRAADEVEVFRRELESRREKRRRVPWGTAR